LFPLTPLILLPDGEVTPCFQEPFSVSPIPQPKINFCCLFTTEEEQNAGREMSTPWVVVGIWNRKNVTGWVYGTQKGWKTTVQSICIEIHAPANHSEQERCFTGKDLQLSIFQDIFIHVSPLSYSETNYCS
jgi:hypothetical protein